MSTPTKEFLDDLAAAVFENPSKEFLDCVPDNVRMELGQEAREITKEEQEARETLHSKHYREMTNEEQEAFKQDWLNDRIPKKPLKRIRFPGEFFYL